MDSLELFPGAIVMDCTLGGGSHSRQILATVGESGRVIGIDRDLIAIEHNKKQFSAELGAGKLQIVRDNFSNIERIAADLSLAGKVNAIIADLGVSSPQIDAAERGFSFAKAGPLDMRMNRDQTLTAADVVNTYAEADLCRIFQDYGEEPKAYYYTKKIVARRAVNPFLTTEDIADFVAANNPYKEKSRRHPALRIFQALRIEVNDELGEVEHLLDGCLQVLAPNGRLAVITFHSLEDRLVKQRFKKWAGQDKDDDRIKSQLRHLPISEDQRPSKAVISILKPFPMTADDQEQQNNPRARTAKLRVMIKI